MATCVLKTIVSYARIRSCLMSNHCKPFKLEGTPIFSQHKRTCSTSTPPTAVHNPHEETRQLENENLHIHSQFRIWPEYKPTVYDISKWNSPESWSSSPLIAQQVKEVTMGPDRVPLMHSALDAIRQTVVGEIGSMNDDEFFRLLYGLSLLRPERVSNPEYKQFWTALDAECCKRMQTWDLETLYVADDLLYLLSFGRSSEFHYQFTKKVCRRLEKGRREHYVRSMFVLNISRALPMFMSPFELEFIFKKLIDGLTTEEIAVVCISFFKTETKVQSVELIEKIVDKTISKSDSLHTIFVGGVAKFLRLSGKIEVSEAIYKFQEAFHPEVPRVDLAAALHLAIAGTTSTTMHKKMITTVTDKVESQLDKTRLKEIERLLLALTMFDIDAPSFYSKVADEMQEERRVTEIVQYGRSLPPILFYLSLRGIYIYDLLDKILQKDFLVKYYGKNMAKYQREIVSLDFSVGLNCPDYKGARLPDKMRKSITKCHLYYSNPLNAEKVTGHMGFLRQAVKMSSAILGGDKFVYWCNALPQCYTAELVFCLDENNFPVEIPTTFREIPDYEVKWIPKEMSNVTFHALYVCNRGSCVHKTTQLLGQKLEQVRQLTKLGYTVHPITAVEWQAYENEPEKQKELLIEKVFNHTLNPKLLENVGIRIRSQV